MFKGVEIRTKWFSFEEKKVARRLPKRGKVLVFRWNFKDFGVRIWKTSWNLGLYVFSAIKVNLTAFSG